MLQRQLIGQAAAIDAIVPFVEMHQAGLAPEGRPVGVFLLLGPTGSGKTKTVEALAEALHGSEKQMIKVDCGEFQMEHEVAKLIGAPPGYLGHRETVPMLNQQKLAAVTSEACNLSLLLFDEIEKAAPSMTRLLLGMLDKAILRLGDNTSVSFERTMIFMTSNLGGQAMQRAMNPDFGFEALLPRAGRHANLRKIGSDAAKRRFSPEFMNRIDAIVPYEILDRQAMWRILHILIEQLQRHVHQRLAERAFDLSVTREARMLLLNKGTSLEYGARELKRVLLRQITQPLAAMVAADAVPPRSSVEVYADGDDVRMKVT